MPVDRAGLRRRQRHPAAGVQPAKAKQLPDWPPKDPAIWRKHEITDTDIDLTTKDGFWFRAGIDHNGYVGIDVHTRVNGKQSSHLGSGRDNYDRMFHHFESNGHPIKGWQGLFIDDNYAAVAKALKAGTSAEGAVLKSVTGEKFWKPWADSKGYKMVVEDAQDHGSFFSFSVRFEPK